MKRRFNEELFKLGTRLCRIRRQAASPHASAGAAVFDIINVSQPKEIETMSKARDQKKTEKKEPTKTLKEKRAAKKEKKKG